MRGKIKIADDMIELSQYQALGFTEETYLELIDFIHAAIKIDKEKTTPLHTMKELWENKELTDNQVLAAIIYLNVLILEGSKS